MAVNAKQLPSGSWRCRVYSHTDEEGIKYQTLLDHVAQPGLFRKYEFNSICEALSLTSDDVLEFHSLTE